eukprot:gene1413-12033_t
MNTSNATVSLYSLVQHLTHNSYKTLKNFTETLDNHDVHERKKYLKEYFNQYKEKYVRLLIVIRWCKKMQKVDDLKFLQDEIISKHQAIQEAANRLYGIDGLIRNIKEPVYDIPTAIDVISTGSYPRLPECIQLQTNGLQNKYIQYLPQTIARLNDLLRMTLLLENIPNQMKPVKVDDGKVIFRSEDEFEIILTLDGNSPDFYWRILSLQFLVNEEGTKISSFPNSQHLCHILQERLYQKLSKDPLIDLYQKLHVFCTQIAYNILHKQALVLNSKFSQIVEVKVEKSIVLSYWKNAPNLMDEDIDFGGIIKIFINEEKDLIIQHVPNFEIESVSLSNLSFNNLLMNYMQLLILYRLKKLKTFLEDKVKYKITIHEDLENGNSYLLMNLFEDVLLLISVDWKSGAWIFNSKYENDSFSRINSLKTNDSISKIPQIISSYYRTILLKEYEHAAHLLELDAFISKNDQEQDCVFIRYPNYQNIFMVVTNIDEITEIQLIYQQFVQEKNFHVHIKTNDFTIEKEGLESHPIAHINSFLKNHNDGIHHHFIIHQLLDRGIIFKKKENFLEFQLDCSNFTGDFFRLFFEGKKWFVETKETKSFVQIGATIGNITLFDSGVIRFNYSTEGIAEFINDLNSVDKMTKLAMDIDKNYDEDEKKSISVMTYNRIVIDYEIEKNYTAEIQWNIEHYSISLSPLHEFQFFIETYFNSNVDMKILLKLLKMVSYSILELKEKNWKIIPKSIVEAKVIFQRFAFIVWFSESKIMIVQQIPKDENPFKIEGNDCKEAIKSLNDHMNASTGLETIQLCVEKNGFSNVKSTSKSISFSLSNGPEYLFSYENVVKFQVANLPEKAVLTSLFEKIPVFDQQHIQSFLNILKLETSFLREFLQNLRGNVVSVLLKIPNNLNIPSLIARNDVRIGANGVKLEKDVLSLLLRVLVDSKFVDVPISYNFKQNLCQFSFTWNPEIQSTKKDISKVISELNQSKYNQLINLK